MLSFKLLVSGLMIAASSVGVAEVDRSADAAKPLPVNFPQFVVPGHMDEMELLRELYAEHYRVVSFSTVWDPWMVKSLLWPASKSTAMQAEFRALLSGRIMAEDGYVSTHQHRGMAHDYGWPFPLWTQVDGWGWHFSGTNNPFAIPIYGVNIQHDLEGWNAEGFSDIRFSDDRGLHANLAPYATLETPPISVKGLVVPFFRFEWWAEGLDGNQAYLEWTTEAEPDYSPDRRLYFEVPTGMESQLISLLPLQNVTSADEVFTRFRIGFNNAKPAKVDIQAVMTAVDSRHNVNNTAWILGCSDYIRITGDYEFLREQIQRMRQAMRYVVSEFQTKEKLCVYTPWHGHDGRSGVIYEAGKKVQRKGFGVGNNYWDLLPFGGYDLQATLYYFMALEQMAELEDIIRDHPEWGVSEGFDPVGLRAEARKVREFSKEFFWNQETERFVCSIDVADVSYDYGFTFLNTEAVATGFADDQQAREVMDWISGRRIVKSDTSKGEDIYHWRFGPRSTTLRNLDYYNSVWFAPERIPFGGQVQDGGAVLGFSYHDLMSRIRVYGPDDAWNRLQEILDWYADVQAEGGVRAYYAKPDRGTLQGGGTAGGLGIDAEFIESALLPQVMLDGFMGFSPRTDGFALSPKLPKEWPSLKITNIAIHGGVYDIDVNREGVEISMRSGTSEGLVLYLDKPVEFKLKPGDHCHFKF